MAKLDAAERKDLPKSEFAGPDRSYPIPDRSHAANAKARASEMLKKGHISKSQFDKINSKADRKLGDDKSKYGSDSFEVGHLQHKDSGQSEGPGNRDGNSQPAERLAEIGKGVRDPGGSMPGGSGVGGSNHINSKIGGSSATRSDPDGNAGEKFGSMRGKADDGANPRKEPLAVASNDSAEQRGDMSDGADGASKDRFWPGSSAARSDRRW